MTKIITKGVRYNSQMYKYGDSHNKMMITWNTKKGWGEVNMAKKDQICNFQRPNKLHCVMVTVHKYHLLIRVGAVISSINITIKSNNTA